MTGKKEKLKELYRAKNKLFKEDWLDTILKLTEGVTLEGFIYAIDAAIRIKGFKFDDIVPFIKDNSFRRKLHEHQELKRGGIEEAIRAHEGSRGRYLALIRDTLRFKGWPAGMTYMIFHQGLIGKWELCNNESQYLNVIEEAEKMFETIKEAA